MGRAPCCERMGLRKGPWSAEEDQILVSYINRYGHANWRALPKRAGLLRCGKSCRLRWTNYLRPDIKRGNFTTEEEETIINLHEKLGNRWSAIAAQLPGRTDNEIKNVWHTHLKKRLSKSTTPQPQQSVINSELQAEAIIAESKRAAFETTSPCSESSYSNNGSTWTMTTRPAKDECMDFSSEELPEFDENLWSEPLYSEGSMDSVESLGSMEEYLFSSPQHDENNTNFWLSILMEAGQLPEF